MITLRAKVLFFSLAMTASVLSLTSCKDDEENAKAKNEFTVDGSATGVKQVAFAYDETAGENDEGIAYYRNELVLLSDGFVIGGGDITGSGSGIILMLTGGTKDLDAGTYNFTGTEENPKPFEIWDATLYTSIATESEAFEFEDFTAGKLTVSKSGSTYTIDLDGTAGGKKVKAHFTGALISFPQN